MDKRGQVTIFIVLGIIVVAIIGLVVYFRGGILGSNLTAEEEARLVSTQVDPIKQTIIDCTKKELVKSVKFVSVQGGYFDPYQYELLGGVNVSYACRQYNTGPSNDLPLLNKIEKEIAEYMVTEEARNNIEICIDNFDFYKDRGLDFDFDFNSFSVDDPQITDTKIRQKITYPITVSRGDSSANVNEMIYTIKSNLKEVHRMATEVVNEVCIGEDFNLADYFWERREEGETGAAHLDNSPQTSRYSTISPNEGQAFYLTSIGVEEDGEPLKFHFIVELL